MAVHTNSLSAYHSLDIGERAAAVLKVYAEASTPLTDREVMRRMGFTDPNQVRPRTTELVEEGLLEECGTAIDKHTQKTVRLCRPTGRALAVKPPDPAREVRRRLCQHVDKMGDQGCTVADLARTFPDLKAADIDLAIGACWAHGALEKRPFVKRENLPVYFITSSGKALLAKTGAA